MHKSTRARKVLWECIDRTGLALPCYLGFLSGLKSFQLCTRSVGVGIVFRSGRFSRASARPRDVTCLIIGRFVAGTFCGHGSQIVQWHHYHDS